MTKKEIQKEVSKMKETDKYLMGTKAYHLLGDISRKEYDLFHARGESDNYWIGMWVTGYGFFNVCFPKETSRELTSKEIEKYNSTYIQVGSGYPVKLNVK